MKCRIDFFVLICISIFLCHSPDADSQAIVNIEQKRIVTDTIGWAGSADLSFRLAKNVETVYSLSTSAHIQFKTAKSLFLFIGNVSVVEAGDETFVN